VRERREKRGEKREEGRANLFHGPCVLADAAASSGTDAKRPLATTAPAPRTD
jgi:hypothetical protein